MAISREWFNQVWYFPMTHFHKIFKRFSYQWVGGYDTVHALKINKIVKIFILKQLIFFHMWPINYMY